MILRSEDLYTLRLQRRDLFIDPQSAQLFRDRFLAVRVAYYLRDLNNNQEGVREIFREIKSSLAPEKRDIIPLRCFLCLQVVVTQIEKSFFECARRGYNPERLEAFVCLYDTAAGITRALRYLSGVIEELYGRINYQELLQRDPGGTADPPRFAVTYPVAADTWAKQVVAARDKLAQDPSGFTLLEESVAEVCTEFADDPKGLLQIAGAKMAQKIYQALYPLTEGI